MSIHDVVAQHLTVEHFEQQLFCGCGFRLWHPGTGFGDPSTVQQDGQTVAEAALAWHLAKKIQEAPERHEAPDVAELRRLAEAATPGPWTLTDGDPAMSGQHWTIRRQGVPGIRVSGFTYGFNGDAAYIAAANPAVVLGLLDRLARMTEARDNAAEVASRGYREHAEREMRSLHQANIRVRRRLQERAEKAEAKAEVLRQKAVAWDEGKAAGLRQSDWEHGDTARMYVARNPYHAPS